VPSPFTREDQELTPRLDGLGKLVVWPQDCGCDRKWLLEKVEGAIGLVVMLTDKVIRTTDPHTTNRDQDLNY